MTDAITQPEYTEKPIQELSVENMHDIERVFNQYSVIPVKYYAALIQAAKKGLAPE